MLKIPTSSKLRYLVVGGVNTVFGYLVGILIFKLLNNFCGIWIIGLVSNILALTFSFTTYKLYVFKTRGGWLQEYLKSYVVYGVAGLFSIALLWLYVDFFRISIWVAQGMVIISTVILSYIGHSKFTFTRNKNIAHG